MKKRKLSRWFIGIAGTLIGILLLLQAAFFFFGNEIFKESILLGFRQYGSTYEEERRPELDFDNLSFNLINGSFSLTGLQLSLYLEDRPNADHLKLMVPEVQVNGLGLEDFFRNQRLQLKEVALIGPEIQLMQIHKPTDSSRAEEVLRKISARISASVRQYLRSFSVDRVEVRQATLFVLEQRKKSDASFLHNKFHAQEISIRLDDFSIDRLHNQEEQRLFFSENLSFTLGNYHWLLPDSSYLFRADTLGFSTAGQSLFLLGAEMYPLEKKDSSSLSISIRLPELQLRGLNVEQLYHDSLLRADELLFRQGEIDIVLNRRDTLSQGRVFHLSSLHADSLYGYLPPFLKEAALKRLQFTETRLSIKEKSDSIPLLQIGSMEAQLAGFRLDTLSVTDSLPELFPADSLVFSLNHLEVLLPDRKHKLATRQLEMHMERQSSYLADMRFDSLSLRPGTDSPEQLLQQPPQKPVAYFLDLPFLGMYGVQLSTLSQWQAAALDSIYLQSPDFRIVNFAAESIGRQASGQHAVQLPGDTTTDETIRTLLHDWSHARLNFAPVIVPGDSAAWLQWLAAGRIQLDSGQLSIMKAKPDMSGYTEITQIDTFYAYINNIRIDHLPDDSLWRSDDGRVAVRAADVDIFLRNSRFRLPGKRGEGGSLFIEDARMNTLAQEVYLRNLYFEATPGRPPATDLWLERMHLPYVRLDGIDIRRWYREQEAQADRLSIYAPELLLNYQKLARKSAVSFDITNLYPQLSDYLESLAVQHIQMQDASTLIKSVSEGAYDTLFQAERLSLQMYNFRLDAGSRMNRIRPFYAHNLLVKADSWQWHFLDAPQDQLIRGLKAAQFRYDALESQLDIAKLQTITTGLPSADMLRYQLSCQKIKIDDIDPYRLIKKQELYVGRLIASKAALEMEQLDRHGDDDSEASLSWESLQPDLNRLLNERLRQIEISSLQINKGKVSLLRKVAADTSLYARLREINLQARDIRIDGQEYRHMHKMLYAEEVDLDIKASHLQFTHPEKKQWLRATELRVMGSDSYVSAGNFELIPSPGTRPTFSLQSSQLDIRGLDFRKAFLYGELQVQQIGLKSPVLQLYVNPSGKQQLKDYPASLHHYISPYLKSINLSRLGYEQGILRVLNRDSKQLMLELPELEAELSRFHLDQAAYEREIRQLNPGNEGLFFCHDIQAEIPGYNFDVDDGCYQVSFGRISLSSGDAAMDVEDLRLLPQQGQTEVLEKCDESRTIVNTEVESVSLRGVNFRKLLRQKYLDVEDVLVNEPMLKAYHDKRKAAGGTRVRPLHQEMLLQMKQEMNIKRLRIQDGYISYAERAAEGEEDGVITFENINANLRHLTNDRRLWKDSLYMSMDIITEVMGEGDLRLSFQFPLADDSLQFSASGNLGPMDLTAFNRILEPVAFVHIKEGTSESLKFAFTGNRYRSNGVLRFRYNDLSILMLDKQRGRVGFDEKLGSFIANAFVLKASNPKGAFMRIGKIDYERDGAKAMFHYWWHSLLTGIKSSIMNEKETEKTRDFSSWKTKPDQ
ncbi:MAG: hypothetical protein ACLFQO_05175 [Cyclobacteriaceae bacterium]